MSKPSQTDGLFFFIPGHVLIQLQYSDYDGTIRKLIFYNGIFVKNRAYESI